MPSTHWSAQSHCRCVRGIAAAVAVRSLSVGQAELGARSRRAGAVSLQPSWRHARGRIFVVAVRYHRRRVGGGGTESLRHRGAGPVGRASVPAGPALGGWMRPQCAVLFLRCRVVSKSCRVVHIRVVLCRVMSCRNRRAAMAVRLGAQQRRGREGVIRERANCVYGSAIQRIPILAAERIALSSPVEWAELLSSELVSIH